MLLGIKESIEVRPEDRVALRREVRVLAELAELGKSTASLGVVTDISVHGLWVAVQTPLALGAEVLVTFAPAPDFEELSLCANVVRVDPHDGPEAEMGMGLAFFDVDVDDQCALEDALSGLPPRTPEHSAPVIAAVEYDALENEVEQILDDEDVGEMKESGVFAIRVDDADTSVASEDFESITDAELELVG